MKTIQSLPNKKMKLNARLKQYSRTSRLLWTVAAFFPISGNMAWGDLASLPGTASLTPEKKGVAIAEAAEIRDSGWGDWVAEAKMILRNSHGESSTRQMRYRSLEQVEAGDKNLVVFDYPRDVKGTAFLVHTQLVGNDDQWLYLPALKRVKRISANNKSGPFVGSEFSYEDLSSQEVEKYTYKFLREETLEGFHAYVLERYPVDPNSGYTKQVIWLDKEEYRSLKIDYFDRKGELLKTLTQKDYKLYGDGFWRADKFHMVNHQTGKSTLLEWNGYQFTQGLRDRDFERDTLRNVR